jgi:hypothetical protein
MTDTLEVVHGLEKAGFSRPQAEAITEAVEKATLGSSARLATKDDIVGVHSELKVDIAALCAELKEQIASVRAELHEIGALAWKAAGLLLAQAAFILAVLKLIH